MGWTRRQALDRPRFCIDDGTAGGVVSLEQGLPDETIAGLADMGHPVQWFRAMPGRCSAAGRSSAATRRPACCAAAPTPARMGVRWGYNHIMNYLEHLPEITRRILSISDPDKIILFGSSARGDAHSDSDLDLLVILRGVNLHV